MGPYCARLEGEILISWCQHSLSVKDSTQQICLFVIHTRPDSATAACERGDGLNGFSCFHFCGLLGCFCCD